MARYRGNKRANNFPKLPLTHFLCLPLITEASRPQLESSLEHFRQLVVAPDGDDSRASGTGNREAAAVGEKTIANIDPRAIRPIGTLHCTLGVMSLDESQLSAAIDFLKTLDMPSLLNQAVKRDLLSGASTATNVSEDRSSPDDDNLAMDHSVAPLQIDLKGLVSMHADYDTSILFCAPTDSSERLLPFCQAVQKLFRDKQFLLPDVRPLKLHATVVNTIYVRKKRAGTDRASVPSKAPSSSEPEADVAVAPTSEQQEPTSNDVSVEGHGINANAAGLRIDARAILDHFKDFIWAEGVVLDRVAICEMGAKKITDSRGNVIGEEYTEVAHVPLP